MKLAFSLLVAALLVLVVLGTAPEVVSGGGGGGCGGCGSNGLTVEAGDDETICMGECVSIQASVGTTCGCGTPSHTYTYLWAPAEGLSDPTSPQPLACPAETTTYTVTVTIDGCGCGGGGCNGSSASDSVTVIVEDCTGECAPRTAGYWYQQCLDQRFEDPYLLIPFVLGESTVFDELTIPEDPCDFLLVGPVPGEPDFRFRRALRQLAPLWFNVASGKILMTTAIDLPGDLGGAQTIGQAIADAEGIIFGASGGNDPVLDIAKDIADFLNNGCYYLQPCPTQPCPLITRECFEGGELGDGLIGGP